MIYKPCEVTRNHNGDWPLEYLNDDADFFQPLYRLSPSESIMLEVLVNNMSSYNCVSMSLDDISEETGYSKSTISDILKKLEHRKCFIRKIYSGRKGNPSGYCISPYYVSGGHQKGNESNPVSPQFLQAVKVWNDHAHLGNTNYLN